MRFTKNHLFLLICCFIISCSLIKTAYNKAPELAIWWLDDYFSFTPAQNLALKPALQNLHNWHRINQLPSYQNWLQAMQTSLAKDQISADEVCGKIEEIKLSIQALQIESVPIVLEIAPSLSDKQLTLFQAKLAKRAEKWKAEWWPNSKEEQLAVRLEKTQDFADKAYGDLSDAQIALLKQSLIKKPINPAISYAEILRRNEDAFQILKALQNQSLSLEEKSRLVTDGFTRIQQSPNQTYQNYADNIAKQTCETISNLHATTSAKQKLHAKNWLQEYIVQLSALQNGA
jgi:Family of unknown function (DUF6279)